MIKQVNFVFPSETFFPRAAIILWIWQLSSAWRPAALCWQVTSHYRNVSFKQHLSLVGFPFIGRDLGRGGSWSCLRPVYLFILDRCEGNEPATSFYFLKKKKYLVRDENEQQVSPFGATGLYLPWIPFCWILKSWNALFPSSKRLTAVAIVVPLFLFKFYRQ